MFTIMLIIFGINWCLPIAGTYDINQDGGIQEHVKNYNSQTTLCKPVTPPCFICTTPTVNSQRVCSDPVVTFKFECTKEVCTTKNPCTKCTLRHRCTLPNSCLTKCTTIDPCTPSKCTTASSRCTCTASRYTTASTRCSYTASRCTAACTRCTCAASRCTSRASTRCTCASSRCVTNENEYAFPSNAAGANKHRVNRPISLLKLYKTTKPVEIGTPK